jgi:predicted ATPase
MASIDTPIVCPVIVGPGSQLAALDALLARVAAGQGRVVLIAVEAGVGKSRLVAEARSRPAGHGFAMLAGHCFESDRAVPFAPLADMLRAFGAAGPESGDALDSATPQLAALMPERVSLPAAPAADAAQDRWRATQAFARFVAETAGRVPLLLVVEDLHWSDDASLEALLLAARRVVTLPLLVVLIYRDDEITLALAEMLTAPDRERLAVEVRLARLDYEETDAMLRAICAQRRPICGDFLCALFDQTEGNPFFIEEVLKSLVAAGDIYLTGGARRR